MVRQTRRPYKARRKAALLLDVVVAVGREQRGLGVFLLLRLDDVADSRPACRPRRTSAMISPGLFWNMSGTTPLVTAATIFWRSGAKGMML